MDVLVIIGYELISNLSYYKYVLNYRPCYCYIFCRFNKF